jgi:hypothetical protein
MKDTYKHTDLSEGFFKYAVDMGSGDMACIPSFMKTGSGIQKLIRGIIIVFQRG